jgi:protein BCP1
MVNVDFEWFDPQPIDFHGMKNLLRQLFDNDAQIFDMSALADLILSQPTLGSTVKVDGHESDPYAFLTILNLQEHKVCHTPAFYLLAFTLYSQSIGQTRHSRSDQLSQDQVCLQPVSLCRQPASFSNPHSPYRSHPHRASDQHALRDCPAHVQHAPRRDRLGH